MNPRVLIVGLGNPGYNGTRHNAGMWLVNRLATHWDTSFSLVRNCKGYIAETVVKVDVDTTPSKPQGSNGLTKKERKRLKQLTGEYGEFYADESTREEHAALLERAGQTTEVPGTIEIESQVTSVDCHVVLLRPNVFMNLSGVSIAATVKKYRFKPQDIMVIHDDLERDVGKVIRKNGGGTLGHNGLRSTVDSLRSDAFSRLRVGIGRPPGAPRDSSSISPWVLGKFHEQEQQKLTSTSWPASLTIMQDWLTERTVAFSTSGPL